MRIYKNALEMVKEVERDLFEMGHKVHPQTMQDMKVADIPDFETIEYPYYAYTLNDFTANSLFPMMRHMIGKREDWESYVICETRERLSAKHINPGEAWECRRKTWEQFLRDGQFSYTYNERFRVQLPIIIRELKTRPETRQAVMNMFNSHNDHANLGGKDRVPCSLTYQFLLRNGKLDLVYTMRSCDLLTHFVYDVYLSCMLLVYVAAEVGVPTGRFVHFIGSLHAYKKDMDARGIF